MDDQTEESNSRMTKGDWAIVALIVFGMCFLIWQVLIRPWWVMDNPYPLNK